MKKKIFVVALVVCILAIAIASATIAYFTDTESATNTFTSGNVAIEMTEAAVKADELGHLVKDDTVDRKEATEEGATFDYGKIFPMQTIYKDPTVQNTGSEKAYIGAIITIKNDEGTIDDLLTVTGETNKTAVNEFITGLVSNGADYTVKYAEVKDDSDQVIALQIYIIKTEALAGADDGNGESADPFFTGVKIPSTWDNDEMAKCKTLSVSVKAYAVQTTGFANAEAAIQAAFGSDFANYFN